MPRHYVDGDVLGGGLPSFVDTIAADVTKTSTTVTGVGASTDQLVTAALPIGTFSIDCGMIFDAPNGEDARIVLGFAGTAPSSQNVILRGPSASDASPLDAIQRVRVGSEVLLVGGTVAGSDIPLVIGGIFTTTDATTSVNVRWAQGSSGATGTTLKAGSYLRITQVV